MSLEEHKAIARRWFAEAWEQGNLAVADEIFAPNFTLSGTPVGPEGPRRNVTATRAAFPDIRISIEDQIAEGDVVVTRYRGYGTHQGAFFGIPPTGRPVIVTGIVIWRFADSKVVEDWTEFDRLGLLQQLDATPRPQEP